MCLTAPFVTALPLEVGRFAKHPACGDPVVAGRASSRQATVSWLRRVAPLPWRLNFDHPYHYWWLTDRGELDFPFAPLWSLLSYLQACYQACHCCQGPCPVKQQCFQPSALRLHSRALVFCDRPSWGPSHTGNRSRDRACTSSPWRFFAYSCNLAAPRTSDFYSIVNTCWILLEFHGSAIRL